MVESGRWSDCGVSSQSENAIRRTLAEYCALIDDGAFDRWAELFSVDAVLKGNGAIIAKGRVGIRRWVTGAVPARSGGMHITVNSVIHVATGSAKVSSDFTYLLPSREGPVLAAAGRYIDQLVREPDRWRFAEREIVLPSGWVRSSAWAAKPD